MLMDGDEVEVGTIENDTAKADGWKAGGPGREAERRPGAGGDVIGGERDAVDEGGEPGVEARVARVLAVGGVVAEGVIDGDGIDGGGIDGCGTGSFAVRAKCGGAIRCGREHAVFEAGVLGAEPVELALDAGVREVDGELAGGDVGGDEDQGDEEDDGSDADEEVSEDELIAEAPQQAAADLPPENGDGEHGEGDAIEDLEDA